MTTNESEIKLGKFSFLVSWQQSLLPIALDRFSIHEELPIDLCDNTPVKFGPVYLI